MTERVRGPGWRGTLHIWQPNDGPLSCGLLSTYWAGALEGLSPCRSSRYALVQYRPAGPDAPPCYFKRFLMRGLRDHLKHCFRASRARRAVRGDRLLQAAGLGVPDTLALLEQRWFGLVRGSAVVTRALEDYSDTYDWFHGGRGSCAERQALVRALGRDVARFHRAGLSHGDMRKSNVLFRPVGEGFDLRWLDNERTRKWLRLPYRERVRNLMDMNMEREGLSRTDRLRFWKAYLDETGLRGDAARSLMRDVIAATQACWRRRGWL